MKNCLKEIRERRGINRTDFARIIGVTFETLWKWEERDKVPKQTNLIKCAIVLETPINTIIPDYNKLFDKDTSDASAKEPTHVA